jgi:hypothetical protein
MWGLQCSIRLKKREIGKEGGGQKEERNSHIFF